MLQLNRQDLEYPILLITRHINTETAEELRKNNIEFIDTAGYALDGRYCFAYSLDGKKVAWIRSFPEKYQEIIIHDLETGEEKTITSAKRNIDELVWVRDDKILYTTERSGFYNVWLVAASGGDPVQITNGMESVNEVKASADGQKIIYLQMRQTTELWLVNVETNRSTQITFGEENQYAPQLSPDGKRIAFIGGASEDAGNIGNIKPSHLYVMGRDGKNKTQLSFGDEIVSNPSWSSDGKRLAYGARKLTEPDDSLRTYLLDLSNPGSRTYISRGRPGLWLDSVRLQVRWKGVAYFTTVEGAPLVPVYDDSTRAFPILGGKHIIFHDLHQGKDVGVWIADGTKPREVQRKTARLLAWHSHNIKIVGMGDILYSLAPVRTLHYLCLLRREMT